MYKVRLNWCSAIGSTVRTLLLFSSLLGGYEALARAPMHSGEKGKNLAPNLEDNANYFSKFRRDISESDLKKADQLRLKTITSIGDLLKNHKAGSRRFELLLRLGELHVERHDFLRDGEMMAYEKSWDQWSKAKDKKGTEPKLNTEGSNEEMLKASESFRKLVTEFPRHPRTDAALYSLARVLARLGKDSSVEYYQQLIKGFPKSPLLADTYLSLGEFYFDKHDIPRALENYKKVMQFKDNRAYPYAVYKLGWAYYNAPSKTDQETLDNYRKAVAAFKIVVKLSDKNQDDTGRSSKSNVNLREEALNDLVLVWADAGDVDTAWNYFRTVGSEESFYKVLERLGNIYSEQGNNQQAIAVYQRLLKETPLRATNVAVSVKLVELYDLTGNTKSLVAELYKMKKQYLGNTPWTTANAANTAVIADANHQCELNFHRFGALFHQRGQKTKNEEFFKTAAEIYALYLANFPENAAAYDIRYYLAEIYFDSKQYDQAAHHYVIIAKSNPKGKYMKSAAFNAVASMNQLVLDKKWPDLPPPGQVSKPLPIPPAKQKLVQTIDLYVSLLPQDKDGEPMRFTAAQTYFDYGHYQDATARFEKITKEIPNTKQARSSVRIVLGLYADKEDWAQVNVWGQTFLKQDKLLDEPLRKYVVDMLQSSSFKQALAFEKDGKFEQAAGSFMNFQKQFPSDGNADRAVYNAMLNYYKVGQIEQAIAAGNLILDKYPKSSVVPDVLATTGSTQESLAKFSDAAKMYQRLANQFPQDKRSPMALFNAAILFKGVNNNDQAIAIFRDFGQRYSDHQIAPDANLALAELLERLGRLPEAVQSYVQFVKYYSETDVERGLLASAKAASINLFKADKTLGQKNLDKVIKKLTAKNAPAALAARTVVAGTLFKLNETAFRDYGATGLNDGAKIEKQVSDKQSKLVKVAAGYEKIIDIGSPEFTVAALFRLGEAHENFANALFKVPAPTGASPAAVDKLRTELEKVAIPLREEAYKFFETAYKRSREVDTFTSWTRLTYQKMVELAPDKHPAVDELSAEPGYLSHNVKMSKPVAELIDAGL